MKKVYLFCIMAALALCFSACSEGDAGHSNSKQTATYSMEDFSHIILGESGVEDLLQVGPCEMLVTSYGGLCTYPAKDGKCIEVVLHGDTGKLIVCSIEYAEAL